MWRSLSKMGLDHTRSLGYISSHLKNWLTPKWWKINLPSNALVSFLKTCCLVLCNVLKSCKTCKKKKLEFRPQKKKILHYININYINNYKDYKVFLFCLLLRLSQNSWWKLGFAKTTFPLLFIFKFKKN